MEFDRQCSTERRHDPLMLMDGTGRNISIRSGLSLMELTHTYGGFGDVHRINVNEGIATGCLLFLSKYLH